MPPFARTLLLATLLALRPVALAAGEMSSASFTVPLASANSGGAVALYSQAPEALLGPVGTSIGQASPLGASDVAGGAPIALPGLWPALAAGDAPARGDADCSGGLSAADVTASVYGLYGGSVCDHDDCDGDGQVTAADVDCAARCVFGACPVPRKNRDGAKIP